MSAGRNGVYQNHIEVILGLYRGNIGIMEKKMETTIVYWGYIGTRENTMETTGFVGVI